MKLRLLLLALAMLAAASGCQSIRTHDYNNWGVPEETGSGESRWHWTPWR